jgi:hypothetical protein
MSIYINYRYTILPILLMKYIIFKICFENCDGHTDLRVFLIQNGPNYCIVDVTLPSASYIFLPAYIPPRP